VVLLQFYVFNIRYTGGASSIKQAASVRQSDVRYSTGEPFGLSRCPLVAKAVNDAGGGKYKRFISELLQCNACNSVGIKKHQRKFGAQK
jgi:hypothetical protein